MRILNKYIMILKPLRLLFLTVQYTGQKKERRMKKIDEIFCNLTIRKPDGLWLYFFFLLHMHCWTQDFFHLCYTASNKDARTIPYLVNNFVLEEVQILSTLTWRQVLTQRRGKTRKYFSASTLISLYFITQVFHRQAQGRENNLPSQSKAWHLKINSLTHCLW